MRATTPTTLYVAPVTRSQLVKGLAADFEVPSKLVGGIFSRLAEVAAEEVRDTGKFTVPGVCHVRTRSEPAREAGERQLFGRTVQVKARPATTVVKASVVKRFKDTVLDSDADDSLNDEEDDNGKVAFTACGLYGRVSAREQVECTARCL